MGDIIKDDGFKFWGKHVAQWTPEMSAKLEERRRRVDELIAEGVPMWDAIRTVCTRIGDIYVGGTKIT